MWGAAFHLVGTSMLDACLQHLGIRECHLGGYEVVPVTFNAYELLPCMDEGSAACSTPCVVDNGQVSERCCRAWAFVAAPSNEYYLGPASVDDLATQVSNSVNVGQVSKLYVTAGVQDGCRSSLGCTFALLGYIVKEKSK